MCKTEKHPSNKIIVIGGGSFQGKSLIASHVSCKLKIPLIIYTDVIRNVLHVLNPKKPYFFTSTYLMSPKNLERQKKEVSNVLQGVLSLCEKRGEHIIVEGMHLSQEFINYLSNKHNVLLFCIDNKLSLEKRLEYKSITRHRVKYIDPEAKNIKYGELTTSNIYFTPYMEHANRIEEIHREIVSYFLQRHLLVIGFENISKGLKKIDAIVNNWWMNKDGNRN